MTAASMLGKFGSPEAESALWRRYASWSAKWTGHESQLDITFGDGLNDKVNQLGLGENLVQALATGKSWLYDKAKLQRLSELSKVKRIHQQQLDRYLKLWEEPAISISFEHNPGPYPFHAQVAQYEFQSLDTLKEKLAQFPSGTKFFLSRPVESSANDQTHAELRKFLSSRGMSLAEDKRAN